MIQVEVAPQKRTENSGVLADYHWWRGVACRPSCLNRGTMAAPMVQLPSNLYLYYKKAHISPTINVVHSMGEYHNIITLHIHTR